MEQALATALQILFWILGAFLAFLYGVLSFVTSIFGGTPVWLVFLVLFVLAILGEVTERHR